MVSIDVSFKTFGTKERRCREVEKAQIDKKVSP